MAAWDAPSAVYRLTQGQTVAALVGGGLAIAAIALFCTLVILGHMFHPAGGIGLGPVRVGYNDACESLNLTKDLGLDPDLARSLANGTLTMRLTLPDSNQTLDVNYSFTGTWAWVNRTGVHQMAIDPLVVGHPYRLSMHLVAGSDDPAVRNATLWARGNRLNLTFSITEGGEVAIALDPGFEAFGDLISDGMGARTRRICLAPWDQGPNGQWQHGYFISVSVIVAD